MKEIIGNLWHYWKPENTVIITTNGTIKINEEAVMGRGVAQQAKQRMPYLPKKLGEDIKTYGNIPFFYPDYYLATLPVKHRWWEQADPELIRRSVVGLMLQVEEKKLERIYLPRPGCGNGGLHWGTQVRPLLVDILDDRFTVVERGV